MPIEVLHGFEPYAAGLSNRDLIERYRLHDLRPTRVTRREELGSGYVTRHPMTDAQVRLGRTSIATVPAAEMLERLSRSTPPRDLQEATFANAVRTLCRNAITALGAQAAVLHAIHGSPSGAFDLKDLP